MADVYRNLVQVRNGRTYDDLGVQELPWPNAERGNPMVIDGTTWEVVDIVAAKVDSPVVAIIAVEPIAAIGGSTDLNS